MTVDVLLMLNFWREHGNDSRKLHNLKLDLSFISPEDSYHRIKTFNILVTWTQNSVTLFGQHLV